MKKLILLLGAITILTPLLCAPASAQLRTEQGKFYWQKTVKHDCPTREVRKKIALAGILSAVTYSDETTIVGAADNILLRYKTIQPVPVLFNKPIPFQEDSEFSATVSYEFSDGEYVVTVKDLIFKSGITLTFGGVSYDGSKASMNSIFFNENGEFSRGKKAREFAELVFDYSFTNTFAIQ